ncbi:uncharacterized protein LOC132637900 [Lycium barbarum]|uniref:uncharacterized protein LOC132637900 n=1 Tax=Lycium barbarum TaxID=112863 RepID=UPI00293E231D|nr:uncharacterized protein LOC132637900 [Lycium barbarum]
MGLSDTYFQTRSSILMLKPFSSMSVVYGMLLSDEKQRQVSSSSQFSSNATSFHASSSQQNFSPKFNFDVSNQNQTIPSKVNFDPATLICKYCKRTRCNRFPPNFKFTKNTRKNGAPINSPVAAQVQVDPTQAQSSSASTAIEALDGASSIPGLSKEQSNQSSSLVQQGLLSFDPFGNPHFFASAKFVGKFPGPSVLLKSYMLSQVASFIWIIDSGATDQMTFHKNLLLNIQSLTIPYLVSLPNGYMVKVNFVGSMTLFPDLGPSLKKPLVLGNMDKGLYKLILPSSASTCDSFPTSMVSYSNNVDVVSDVSTVSVSFSDVCAISNSTIDEDDVLVTFVSNFNKQDVVWHYRLGHIPFSRMKAIPSLNDFSRATWTHLMGAKSNAFDLLKSFISMTETQFELKVQTVRSDNALELGSSIAGSTFFSDKETARALLFQSALPAKFWGDCILTDIYLINRFLSSLLHNKSPYEILYNKQPQYSHLKDFGCLCYCTIPRPQMDKFQPKATPCIFLGYPFAKKGYIVYSLTSKLTFVSRDIVFHEHIFSFALNSTSTPSILPSSLSLYFADPVPVPSHSPIPPSALDSLSSSTSNFPSTDPQPPPLPNPSPISSPYPAQPVHPPPPPELPPVSTRSSSRIHKRPNYLDSYDCHYFGSAPSSTSGQHYVFEPHTYSQAASVPEWKFL